METTKMKAIKTQKTVKTVKAVKAQKVEETPKAEKPKIGWKSFEDFDVNIFRCGGMANPSQPYIKAEGEETGLKEGAILFGGIIRPAKIGKKIIITKDFLPAIEEGEIERTLTFKMSRSLVESLGGKLIFAEELKKPSHLIDTKAGELQGWSLGEKGKWSAYALILKSGKILFSQKESGGSKFPNAKRIAENSFVKGIVKQLA